MFDPRSPSIATHHDTIPNFAAAPTIATVADGDWHDPAIWSLGRLPGPGDIAAIAHAVSFSGAGEADVIGIEPGGKLTFSRSENSSLRVVTLLVMPQGVLDIGTPSSQIPASVSVDIVIRDVAPDIEADPLQFGTGILCVDGEVSMHGAPKLPTFARIGTDVAAGDTGFALEEAVAGWAAGDTLVIPDSRPGGGDHYETAELQSVEA